MNVQDQQIHLNILMIGFKLRSSTKCGEVCSYLGLTNGQLIGDFI